MKHGLQMDNANQSSMNYLMFEDRPNYLAKCLKQKADAGYKKLFSMKYELQNKAVIYLHLRNQEFAFVNKIAYKLKNYGLKLKFGDPTINDVNNNYA